MKSAFVLFVVVSIIVIQEEVCNAFVSRSKQSLHNQQQNVLPPWPKKRGSPLHAKKRTSSTKSTSTGTSRTQKLSNLDNWSKDVGIQLGGVSVQESDLTGGLGIVATRELKTGDLVLTVPTPVALSVEVPGDGPDDRSILRSLLSKANRRTFPDLPWYAQFAVYLYKLDQLNPMKNNLEDTDTDAINMQPWLDSLPRSFTTPIHWSESKREELLQYRYLSESVTNQEKKWRALYESILQQQKEETATTAAQALLRQMTWEDFLWGCECSRSRAFSGAYTGSAFNPYPYAFTLLLVLAYVGLNLGTIEQAANGAGLVFCATVFQNFILPKLFKKKRYVICPLMDMANHKSLGTTSDVSFEFFNDAYSLAMTTPATLTSGSELFISYGARSNDQLLQYYGFVECDNPHDVYIMPPLREWDISALETACGKQFSPGRLQKLDRAGLLGNSNQEGGENTTTNKDDTEVTNVNGGVVVTRATGVDPAIVQAMRALVSTDEEWEACGEAIGNFVEEYSAGAENERLAKLAIRTGLELELAAKATTLEEDYEKLNQIGKSVSFLDDDDRSSIEEEKLALLFRIEKKKLLKETLEKLR